MDSLSLNASEALSASGATAPRVSIDSMKSKIAHEHYFTAAEACCKLGHNVPAESPLDILTVCILVMRNGFTVIGKSAPASRENFDEGKGRTFAYEDAIRQLWPLEGYALRERLAA